MARIPDATALGAPHIPSPSGLPSVMPAGTGIAQAADLAGERARIAGSGLSSMAGSLDEGIKYYDAVDRQRVKTEFAQADAQWKIGLVRLNSRYLKHTDRKTLQGAYDTEVDALYEKIHGSLGDKATQIFQRSAMGEREQQKYNIASRVYEMDKDHQLSTMETALFDSHRLYQEAAARADKKAMTDTLKSARASIAAALAVGAISQEKAIVLARDFAQDAVRGKLKLMAADTRIKMLENDPSVAEFLPLDEVAELLKSALDEKIALEKYDAWKTDLEERRADEAREETQDNNTADLLVRIMDGPGAGPGGAAEVTDAVLQIALKERDIDDKQFRSLMTFLRSEGAGQDKPGLVGTLMSQLYNNEADGADVMEQANNLTTDSLKTLLGVADQIERRGGTFATYDVRESVASIKRVIAGATGELVRLTDTAAALLDGALREFHERVQKEPDNHRIIAEDIIDRYRPARPAFNTLPTLRMTGLRLRGTDVPALNTELLEHRKWVRGLTSDLTKDEETRELATIELYQEVIESIEAQQQKRE